MNNPLDYVKIAVIGIFGLLGAVLAYFVIKMMYDGIMGAVNTTSWDSTSLILVALLPAIVFFAIVAKIWLSVGERRRQSGISQPRQKRWPWQ